MKKQRRMLITLVLSGVILLALVGTTVAYFAFNTDSVANRFNYGKLEIDIDEQVEYRDYDTKKEVKVENKGSIDAYVSAMLVPVFREGNGAADPSYAGTVDYSQVNSNGIVLVTSPDGETEYTLQLASGWSVDWHFNPSTNTFYYKKVLAPGELTSMLLSRVTTTEKLWKGLQIEVLADAVQAEGDTVAAHLKDVWGVSAIDPDNGSLTW